MKFKGGRLTGLRHRSSTRIGEVLGPATATVADSVLRKAASACVRSHGSPAGRATHGNERASST